MTAEVHTMRNLHAPVLWLPLAAALSLSIGLVGCSTSSKKPTPAPLPVVQKAVGASSLWTLQIGAVNPLTVPVTRQGQIYVANAAAEVFSINASTGKVNWQVPVGSAISAGLGSDGESVALVTRDNELVSINEGKVAWRVKVGARVFTPPLVAGKRVFVLAADRSVTAFDGANGARLWTLPPRGTDPLVLQQPGVLLAVRDTLIAGVSGRLIGINPNVGATRWEVPLANPRGINEIERLVDVVAPAARLGDQVCARSFQAAVGCVDTTRGTLRWTKPAVGDVGVQGDDDTLFSAENNGKLMAWKRASGETAWTNEALLHRGLTSPALAGNYIAIGDAQGYVHFVTRDKGVVTDRVATDGSAIVHGPFEQAGQLYAVTQKGGVYGWRLP